MKPLRLGPILVEKPWGGRRLAELGRALPDGVLVGESWDVADLTAEQTSQSDPVTRVVGGEHDGAALHELIASHREELLGDAEPTADGRFPLLVKHLDAAQHLSVQVHPPESLVVDEPRWSHKTESWVVTHADENAVLFLGLRDGTVIGDVEAALGSPAIVELLRPVPARAGDVHHLPAGLIHALGAGVVVAEVQTPSDTTFRLYDWTEEYGRADRELHVDAGLTSIRAAWDLNLDPPVPVEDDGVVVDTEHYVITRRRVTEPGAVPVQRRRAARVLIVLDGIVNVPGGANLSRGGVTVVPATWAGELTVAPDASWLDVDLVPS